MEESYDLPDPLLLFRENLPMLNKRFGQCSHPWFYFRLDASRAGFISSARNSFAQVQERRLVI